jgi:hypothetical protein
LARVTKDLYRRRIGIGIVWIFQRAAVDHFTQWSIKSRVSVTRSARLCKIAFVAVSRRSAGRFVFLPGRSIAEEAPIPHTADDIEYFFCERNSRLSCRRGYGVLETGLGVRSR